MQAANKLVALRPLPAEQKHRRKKNVYPEHVILAWIQHSWNDVSQDFIWRGIERWHPRLMHLYSEIWNHPHSWAHWTFYRAYHNLISLCSAAKLLFITSPGGTAIRHVCSLVRSFIVLDFSSGGPARAGVYFILLVLNSFITKPVYNEV